MKMRFSKFRSTVRLGAALLCLASPAAAFMLSTPPKGTIDIAGVAGSSIYGNGGYQVTIEGARAASIRYGGGMTLEAGPRGGQLIIREDRRNVVRVDADISLSQNAARALELLAGHREDVHALFDQADLANYLATLGVTFDRSSFERELAMVPTRAIGQRNTKNANAAAAYMAEAVFTARVNVLDGDDSVILMIAAAPMGDNFLMLPAKREQPLWFDETPGATFGHVISGQPLAVAKTASPPGFRAVCAYGEGCGFVDISNLVEVTPIWVKVSKATGAIREFVYR